MTNWFINRTESKRIECCSLLGCTNPKLRPHHHHFARGHLTCFSCKCNFGGEPGLNKKEKK